MTRLGILRRVGVGVVAAAALCACGERISPPTTTTTTSSSTSTSTTSPPTTTTTTTLPPVLEEGASGPAVLALQQRLEALHYWVGTPDGFFGDSTEQAVFALQKAARIARDGLVGAATTVALDRGVEPTPRPAAGRLVEVDLSDDLLMFVDDGKLVDTLNTSTGGGYWYPSGDGEALAETPTGVFHVYSEIDGADYGPLGELWRPKFFEGGFAVHGDAFVPPYPVSHGCVRVSDEAIDWIWSDDLMPLGTEVWIYG